MPVFRAGKIPTRIKGGEVELDLLTCTKWPCYYRLLKKADKACLENLGFETGSCPLKIFLWSLFLFSWAYIVKFKTRPVGIVGIYGFEPRIRLFLTLAIFQHKFRRKGIGRQCVSVLSRYFKATGICKQMLVEVKKDNGQALNFWEENGFRLINETHATTLLTRRP